MIVFVTGPMFSSKSKRMAEYYYGATFKSKENVLVFKPYKDTRDGAFMTSREGKAIRAILIHNLLEIIDYVQDGITDIFIDEVNFFENIPDDTEELTKDFFIEREKRIQHIILLFEYLNYVKGVNIFMAGLDFNSERKPFGISPYLMCIATHVDKLNARCNDCMAPATHSNFKGVKNIEIVVGSDEYNALCPTHWFVAQDAKDNNFTKKLLKK